MYIMQIYIFIILQFIYAVKEVRKLVKSKFSLM